MKEVKYIPGDLVNPNGNIAKVISVTPDLVKCNISIGFSDGWCFTAHYKILVMIFWAFQSPQRF